jgi:hypothetical protein
MMPLLLLELAILVLPGSTTSAPRVDRGCLLRSGGPAAAAGGTGICGTMDAWRIIM